MLAFVLHFKHELNQGQASGMDWTLHTDLWKSENKNNCQILFLRNNIWKLFFYIVGGRKEKWNLRIALINFIVMRFISNFDKSFYS